MNEEVSRALLEYEQLKLSIKAEEARLDKLKEIIMPAIEEGKKYSGTEGVFEVVSKASWKFSDRVKNMKDEVKQAEAEEIAKGLATNTPTVYLKYTMTRE